MRLLHRPHLAPSGRSRQPVRHQEQSSERHNLNERRLSRTPSRAVNDWDGRTAVVRACPLSGEHLMSAIGAHLPLAATSSAVSEVAEGS
jgi:hypothetical protein